MRILFISTFYPPFVVGGWEQLVEDLNLGLRARGHTTFVLTSNHGLCAGDPSQAEPAVDRGLLLESNLQYYQPAAMLSYQSRVRHNIAHTQAAIKRWQPDVVFVHIMWNLTRAIPWAAEQLMPGRVVYYVADHWLYAPDTHSQYWQDIAGNPLRGVFKRLLAPLALKLVQRNRERYPLALDKVLCVSEAIRQALLSNTTIRPDQVQVVYNGIDLAAFPFQPCRLSPGQRQLRLLYAGSLVPHKGVHTAIEAMALLARAHALDGLTLTIVGSGRPDYEVRLQALVAEHGLHEHVFFAGRVGREAMPAQLAGHDVLIFPSQWPEPLARMTQEAMACGLIVIGTTTGGTGEILVEGETGLVFAPGDAKQLAQRIQELRDDPALYNRLAASARQRVEAQFDFQRMLERTEAHLSEVAARAAPAEYPVQRVILQ